MRLSGPILFILATLMIDAIGIGLVYPIMPDLMTRVGAGSIAEGSVWGGVLMAAYAGALFLCGPVVGSISDAFGRRPVLIAALTVLAVDYLIMALASTFWVLLIGRILAGVAGATYITATAYISDITPPEERAARFGLIGAAFGIGFVLGPAIGGLAATIDITAPFWIAAGLSALNVVFGIFVLPESLTPDRRRPFGRRDLNPFGAILRAFAVPALIVPLICIVVFEFANMTYATLWSFWTKEVFGFSALWIGVSLAAYGVMLSLAQIVALPALQRSIGDHRTLLFAMVLSIVAMLGFGFGTGLYVLFIFLPLAALSDLVPALLTAKAANAVGEDAQGLVQGVIASLSSLAAVASPVAMTAVFRTFADEGAPVYLPGAPFLLAALLVMAIVPLAMRLR